MADLRFDPTRPVHCYVHGLQLADDSPSRYFMLVIHPTVEHMRAAAIKQDRRRGGVHGPGFYQDALGLFQPTDTRARWDKASRKWVDTTPRFSGVMRLVQGNMTREIVAHECVHAILHIVRLESWRTVEGGGGDADFGSESSQEEEDFAYLLSETTIAVDQLVDEFHEGAGLVRALS